MRLAVLESLEQVCTEGIGCDDNFYRNSSHEKLDLYGESYTDVKVMSNDRLTVESHLSRIESDNRALIVKTT